MSYWADCKRCGKTISYESVYAPTPRVGSVIHTLLPCRAKTHWIGDGRRGRKYRQGCRCKTFIVRKSEPSV